ncbi:PfaD family polyunsaturated fatty acid/polyketide biosynthesis protein [Singulisphaera sp. Ch08]|uniref:PfaD family polyunsaturated fatty acid/polyketide biosynthesis protein n=1 Tax=Singulisphaera sp. Ch08 TaxID=3120278 RepID=A0AAU7CA14_9BACT
MIGSFLSLGVKRPVVIPATYEETLERALCRVGDPFLMVERGGSHALMEWDLAAGEMPGGDRVAGVLPACRPEDLGDISFREAHRLRFPYVAGAMANGIASAEIVEAMGRAGMLGIFGAAGLPLSAVETAIDRLGRTLGPSIPYGFNLIHSPNEPELEAAVAALYLKRGIRLVEASAYLDLTLPVVRYRVHGLRLDGAGQVVAPNRIIAKVSRVEVASKFLAPPPAKFLRELVASGEITEEQANWAARIPMADDVTAEADSGGHTDNQPAIVLLPTLLALRDRMQAEHGYDRPLRIGAAGGISSPWSAAGALAMGASYLVTGSVNQACVEAGTSDPVRKMLAEARQADIAMAPAADMFEMGVKVQVLKRGTMFAMRAGKLFEFYRSYDAIEQIPAADRALLEKNFFRAPLETIWDQTRTYFQTRDPAQIERGTRDPKHKMALIFRWYLGQSSHWANAGEPTRAVDYQIWCGPAMAAFNDWVRGSFLERPENRRVVTVALNILYGAAVLARARCLGGQGIAIPAGTPRLAPLELPELEDRLTNNATRE